ncbi:MAG: carbohydrate-binding domain-containing protein, partial [Bacilli bacterium]|nr:carbohydrate-binding domain-containing protein [Bacilli bacterium]
PNSSDQDIEQAASKAGENSSLPETPSDPTALANVKKITASGDYLLTGESTQAIEIGEGLTVNLVLRDVNLHVDGIALSSKKNCEVTLFLEGENVISSTSGNNAIHIKGNLTVLGNGKSTVQGGKNAIKVSKRLTIQQTELTLSAENHGLSAETILAENAKINVTSAGKDGIHAELDYDNLAEADAATCVFTLDDGYVILKNVEYTASSVKGDGVQADTFLYVEGGTYTIATEGEWVAKTTANQSAYGLTSDDFKWIKSGSTYTRVSSDELGRYSASNLYALTQSCKGMKVGEISYDTNGDDVDDVSLTQGDYSILIKSGTFNINTDDDGIHTNWGSTYIEGGTIT